MLFGAQPPTRACVGLPARNRLARSRTVPLERCGVGHPLSVTDGAVTACFALRTAATASKAGQATGAIGMTARRSYPPAPARRLGRR